MKKLQIGNVQRRVIRNSYAVVAAMLLEHSSLLDSTAYDVARKTKKIPTFSTKELLSYGISWDDVVVQARRLLTKPQHHCRTQACAVVDFFHKYKLTYSTLKEFQRILSIIPDDILKRYVDDISSFRACVESFTHSINYLSEYMPNG